MKVKSTIAILLMAVWVYGIPAQAIARQTVSSLRVELAQCQLDRSSLQHYVAELEAKLASVASDAILRRRAETAENALGRTTSELDSTKRQLETLRRELQTVRGENNSLRTEVASLRSAATQRTPPSVQNVPIPNVGGQGVSPGPNEWRVFENTAIDGIINKISHGTIFKTSSGNIYEVTDHIYDYEFAFHPQVTVLVKGDTYRLIIDGIKSKPLCKIVVGGSPKPTSDQFESFIDGNFGGFSHGNIYKLRNGQIWEQTNYTISVRVRQSPAVLVYRDGSQFKMRLVDDFDNREAVVRRIK